MNEGQVTAVVVAYRSEATIVSTLEALEACRKHGLASCVVIENASGDGTASLVRKRFPWVDLIESPQNMGFGRGCNVGWRRAKTPYVMFINPDAVLLPEAFEHLLAFMAGHRHVGLAAPAIECCSGEYQSIHPLPSPWRVIMAGAGLDHRLASPKSVEPGTAPFRTQWLCGALLMARRDLMEQLGGFDSRFFLYFEETDLCVRAEAMGAELWAVGTATAHHDGNASADQVSDRLAYRCIPEHYYRSRFYYLCKHHGWLKAVAAELFEVLFMGARAVYGLVRGRSPRWFFHRLRSPILQLPKKKRDG